MKARRKKLTVDCKKEGVVVGKRDNPRCELCDLQQRHAVFWPYVTHSFSRSQLPQSNHFPHTSTYPLSLSILLNHASTLSIFLSHSHICIKLVTSLAFTHPLTLSYSHSFIRSLSQNLSLSLSHAPTLSQTQICTLPLFLSEHKLGCNG